MNKYLKLVVNLIIVTGCNGQKAEKATSSDGGEKEKQIKKEYINILKIINSK